MKFKQRKILTEIKEFYQQPISENRFKEYLHKLQGESKSDLLLPIAGFNPMAKDHIIPKIEELESCGVEDIMDQAILAFNKKHASSEDAEFLVVLNLADDLKGAWTNTYVTDYDSKFKLGPFIERKFCVPYFWTSENYSESIILRRTNEYLLRSLYRSHNPQPITLQDHIDQEVFVARSAGIETAFDANELLELITLHQDCQLSEENDLIFNFFYGDAASASLGYKQYGVHKSNGYDFAKYLAFKTEQNQF